MVRYEILSEIEGGGESTLTTVAHLRMDEETQHKPWETEYEQSWYVF